jgi:hypothetical protein
MSNAVCPGVFPFFVHLKSFVLSVLHAGQAQVVGKARVFVSEDSTETVVFEILAIIDIKLVDPLLAAFYTFKGLIRREWLYKK